MFDNTYCLDSFVQIFKNANLKLTPQRLHIFSYLKNVYDHPTADTIYKNVKTIIPTISLATVYKNLKTLVESKLIRELNVCEENFRYDANMDLHGHIKCLKCQKVKDIQLETNLKNYLISSNNCKIDCFDVIFYGQCEDCKEPMI